MISAGGFAKPVSTYALGAVARGGTTPDGHLGSPTGVMKKQLRCHIWQEGNTYVAAQDDALVHAFGSSPQDASLRLADALIEQHERLHDLGIDRLYPHLREVLAFLDEALDSERYSGFVLVPE